MPEETSAVATKTYDDLDGYIASLTDEEREQLAIAEASFNLADADVAEDAPKTSCGQCGKELDWRDRSYGGKAKEATEDAPAVEPTCKRCHAQAAKAARRGVLHQASQMVMRGKKLVEVPILFNRAARRDRRKPPKPIAEKPPKRTRAMRRQAAREKAAQVAA